MSDTNNQDETHSDQTTESQPGFSPSAPTNLLPNKLQKQMTIEAAIWQAERDQLKFEIYQPKPDLDSLEAQLQVFKEVHQKLLEIHQKILDELIEEDDGAAYRHERTWSSQVKSEAWLLEVKAKRFINNMSTSDSKVQPTSVDKSRKLPKLELPKFNGDVRDWLPYWSQFQEIHADKNISNSDKFQYLVQSTLEGSEARELVMSYPITADNYPLAVELLKKRYGKEKMLVKVYVRDLLRLVIDNAKNEKVSLSSLFVKLSAQLRALGTLGVTTDKCAAVIYPLVESCLPEEVLRAWQRDPSYKEAQEKDGEQELEILIQFLEREVGAEDNIKLACGGLVQETPKGNNSKSKSKPTSTPTAASLISVEGTNHKKHSTTCIFCGKSHESHECGRADQMTLDEKKKCIEDKRACSYCLGVSHSTKKCRQFIKCLICTKRHRTIMCTELSHHRTTTSTSNDKKEQEASSSTTKSNTGTEITSSVADLANQAKSQDVLLQTVVIEVQGSKGNIRTRALFDTGAQRSYIREDIVDKIGLPKVGEEDVIHLLFGGLQTKITHHNRYKILLKSLQGSYACRFDVSDTPSVCGNVNTIPSGPWIEEASKKGISFSDHNPNLEEIGILLGADVAGKLMTGERFELTSGPVAVKTLLGWTLMGKLPLSHSSRTSSLHVYDLHTLDVEVQKLWDLEAIGISDPTETRTRQELEDSAIEHFNETTNRTEEGRYQVHLPWVEGHPPLPTNRAVAERRLKCATDTMKKEKTLQQYNKVLNDWEESGMIEEVPSEEMDQDCHYLPHRAVYKPQSTTPIRPVFDASSKAKGHPSLNDCMEKGPNLLEQIPAVITKFRLNPTGVVADIKKAFQQISVVKRDRDFLRFLWWTDESCNKLKVFRHTRVVFGVSSSPFLLGATLKHIVKSASPELATAANTLNDCTYVDNLVASVKNIDEVQLLQSDCDKLLLPAKFELRGWEHGPSEDEKEIPVLGMLWNTKQDNLHLDMNTILRKMEGNITKRKILSLVHMLFDPIGFTCPVTIIPKKMIQETWALKLGWDAELPVEMAKRFESWRNQLSLLQNVKIPRWMNPHNEDRNTWTLHVFCDASKDAFAAAVYLRTEGESGVSVQLIQGKSRVAPLKKITIPRLELLACGIGARLAATVKKMISFPEIKTYYWTDSSTSYYWIHNVKNWGVFVQRRVDEIKSLSNVDDWRHVPGELNPADLPSRGCSSEQLIESKWWEGCNWLHQPESEWPNSAVNYNQNEIDSEKKKTVVSALSHENCVTYKTIHQMKSYEEMVEYVHKCRHPQSTEDEMSTEDFTNAELDLFRWVQKWHFTGPMDDKLKKLPVMKDDHGILRLNTRLTHGDFNANFKAPIVLPSKSAVVHELIRFEHEKNSHAWTTTLLALMRERVWIIKGRQTIRSVLNTCQQCQRFTSKSLNPATAALPRERIQASSPFEVTGVDLFGPLFLKNGKKCWVALFTCATYRAVHLEPVPSLSTSDFKNALRKFIGRRGRPAVIYSDNGTNFVGCNNSFRSINWQKISKYATLQRIDWRFNPPTASWWGGFWERLVGVVKQTLRKVLGKACLNYDELATVLCDVEAAVNQRPLTYLSEDPQDLAPLTPQMFIIGERSSHIPEADLLDSKDLNIRIKVVQQMREHLRSRFRKEYLGQLTNPRRKEEKRQLKVGDAVLIGHDGQKRLDWPLGRITELIPGKDGRIRVVRVDTEKGTLLRPVQRIYPMEVPANPVRDSEDNEEPELLQDRRVVAVTRSGRRVKIPQRLIYLYI